MTGCTSEDKDCLQSDQKPTEKNTEKTFLLITKKDECKELKGEQLSTDARVLWDGVAAKPELLQ